MLEVIPAEQAREIIDPAAQDSLRQIESVRLRFGDYEVDSTFLGPDESSPNKPGKSVSSQLHVRLHS